MAQSTAKNKKQVPVKKFTGADYYRIFLLLFTVAVIPLAVHALTVPTAPEAMANVRTDQSILDIFSYYKSAFLICAAVLIGLGSFASNSFKQIKHPIALIFFVLNVIAVVAGIATGVTYNSQYQSDGKEIVLSVLLIVLYTVLLFPAVARVCAGEYKNKIDLVTHAAALIFAELIIYSAAFSAYKHVALFGQDERYENAFVLLGYILIFLEALRFLIDKARVKIILYGVLFSAAVVCLIGTFQYAGLDFFMSGIGQTFLAGSAAYQAAKAQGATVFSHVFQQIYSTIYNPNCVGMYTALIFPLTLIAGVFWPKKSPVKYIMLVISALSVVCLFGCGSTGGLVGFCTALVVGAVTVFIYLMKRSARKALYLGSLGGAIVVVLCVAFLVPPIHSKLADMAGKFASWSDAGSPFLFQDAALDGNHLTLDYTGGSLDMTVNLVNNSPQFNFTDADGSNVDMVSQTPLTGDDGSQVGVSVTYESSVLGQFILNVQTNGLLVLNKDNFMLYLGLNQNGSLTALTQTLKPTNLNTLAPSVGFTGKETFASSRGYIWSRSIPLLSKYFLLGAGPDTFMVVFPQNDIRGKIFAFGQPYMTVDKAHNFYLHTAVTTGIPSLIAVLAVFVCFYVKNLRAAPTADNEMVGLRLGIVAGVTGYLTAALATDSTVSVSPVFWVVLALGFAVAAIDKPTLRVVR